MTELPQAFGRTIDTTLCNTDSLRIRPVSQATTAYAWENGSTNPARVINQPGVYTLTATRGECSVTDTLRVRREVSPVLPPDTVLCRGESLTLTANRPQTAYQWSTGSTDSTLTVSSSGTYQLRIPSPTCQLTDAITVDFLDCPDTGLIPNAITPNGDGKNDTFRVENVELSPWRFEVYNRWGRRVYESFPYRNEWDGEHLPGGVYYYSLHNDRLNRHVKGWVQLIR